MAKIVIYVSGGSVQSVYSSDKHVDVELLDMDVVKNDEYETEQHYVDAVANAEKKVANAEKTMFTIL